MSALIDNRIEQILQLVIFPDLERGRQDFDRPHTEAVVYWMKELLQQLQSPTLDSQVLITAAYAHDWGYIGLFEGRNSNSPSEIKKRKPLHMERGATLIEDLIHKRLFEYFTSTQLHTTSQLVFMHNRVEELQSEAEILIMEADTLGMLDVERVKPTFSKEDNDVFIQNEIYGRRLPAFIHPFAKENAEKLVLNRIAFYQ